jgi:hypothetical protein
MMSLLLPFLIFSLIIFDLNSIYLADLGSTSSCFSMCHVSACISHAELCKHPLWTATGSQVA